MINFTPKLQEQISHTVNPIKSVFSLIFIFYGLNLTGGSSGEKLFGCLIASLPAFCISTRGTLSNRSIRIWDGKYFSAY